MDRHKLAPAASMAPETVAAPLHKTGGLVGGFIEFAGSSNKSWTANASYLPLQCTNPQFHEGHGAPSCPKDADSSQLTMLVSVNSPEVNASDYLLVLIPSFIHGRAGTVSASATSV